MTMKHTRKHLNRLATLIPEKQRQIVEEWKAVACKLPGAQHLDEPLLLDHLPQVLQELSWSLTQAQSVSILEMKAHVSAKEHGAVRFKLGFDIEQVIAEFGLLRDVIQQFAEANGVDISGEVNRTVNRVIDKAIAGSVQMYVQQQAGEVERKRREYLSFLVHDLKTPIAAIATATHVIDQQLASEPRPYVVTAKMVEILRRNTSGLNNRVMEIINEESRLLALATEADPLPLELNNIDLWPIVERLKDDCQSIAESQGNTIRNEVPHSLQICADPDLLMELLLNLLSNALKYTTKGEIVIGGSENPDSVAVLVRDTGLGISPERINQIFHIRSGDPNLPESTGLGLAVVEKVMQLHGGTISVESTPGIGSTFRMEFPNKRCEAA